MSDPDDVDLEGATVEITANYVNGEDTLGFVDQLGIMGSFNATNGILTLTGTSSIANYQTALRNVTYENKSEDPCAATRTVEFKVDDGEVQSDPFGRDINVIPINDKPTITGSGTAIAYTEGQGPVAIDPVILVDDVDNTNLASATVAISVNYVMSEDTL